MASHLKLVLNIYNGLPSPNHSDSISYHAVVQSTGSGADFLRSNGCPITYQVLFNLSILQCPLLYKEGNNIFIIFLRIKWVKWKAPRILPTRHHKKINKHLFPLLSSFQWVSKTKWPSYYSLNMSSTFSPQSSCTFPPFTWVLHLPYFLITCILILFLS